MDHPDYLIITYMIVRKTFSFMLLIFGLLAFKAQTIDDLFIEPSPISPTLAVKKDYIRGLQSLIKEVEKLNDSALRFNNDESYLEELQEQLVNTRMTFKKVEFILDYLDPSLVYQFINGAPLPKLEQNIPEIVVLEPKGLQILDELIFLNPDEEIETIIKLSSELKEIIKKTLIYQQGKSLQHRYIMESARYGIVRVFSLGVTGFDTPGSVNGIEESRVAMQSMYKAISHYENMSKGKARLSYEKTITSFEKSLEYLSLNSDFDNFDRMYFLKEYINPLYTNLYDLQKSLSIEFVDEVDPTLQAHNYHSRHIFSTGFFNSSFYTEIATSDLVDPKKVELGKMLFFDPVLSRDLNMSCASCHHPDKAFTDGMKTSESNQPGVFTQRNAPSLVNSVYYPRYFWDMREYDLERQIKHVVHDKLEFNLDFIDLADRLKTSSEYHSLFEEAYGDRDRYGISSWSISNSLAAYVNSLSSFNSRFDKYVRGESTEYSEQEKRGFNLFMGKAACGTCHFAPAFNGTVPPYYKDGESEVLGVLTSFDTINPVLDNDPGRVANGLPSEAAPHLYRSMKTVTVRNAELTAPYMHNGSLTTLEEVMHFYNKGGGAGMGLEVPHQTLPDAHLNLTQSEMDDIVAFMKSLTDTGGMKDVPKSLPSFESNPEWNNRKAIDY